MDPPLHVGPSVAEMSADPESRWALVAVAPCVDRRYRNFEVVGEVFDGEQPIEGFHGRILRLDH